jgi:hypothetical protein
MRYLLLWQQIVRCGITLSSNQKSGVPDSSFHVSMVSGLHGQTNYNLFKNRKEPR